MNENVYQNKNINEYHNTNQNTFYNYHNEPQNIEENNKIPSTLLVCRIIQNQEALMPTKMLLDSGASDTMIHSRCLPSGATPSIIPDGKTKFQTVAGLLDTNRKVFLDNIVFPEFDKTKRISGATAYVFDTECKYDMIIGRDILHKIGLTLCFDKKEMRWLDSTLPMKTADFWQTPLSYFWALDDDVNEDGLDLYTATKIEEAKYEKIEINDVINTQNHLNKEQQNKLKNVLEKYNKLFDGGLGHYTKTKIHIDLDPSIQPRHFKPYPIPKIHLPTFKKELDHLIEIGVLEKNWDERLGLTHIYHTKKRC